MERMGNLVANRLIVSSKSRLNMAYLLYI